MGHEKLQIEERVGENPISNCSNNNNNIQIKNGKGKNEKSTKLKKMNDRVNSNDEEKERQMDEEDSAGDNLEKVIEKGQKKSTYAEVLLKGTGKGRKRVGFKI